MIPSDLHNLMVKQPGNPARADSASAKEALRNLGVVLDSELGEFFLEFRVSTTRSKTSNEELADVASPTPQMAAATEFVREVYEVPDQFLCLTTG